MLYHIRELKYQRGSVNYSSVNECKTRVFWNTLRPIDYTSSSLTERFRSSEIISWTGRANSLSVKSKHEKTFLKFDRGKKSRVSFSFFFLFLSDRSRCRTLCRKTGLFSGPESSNIDRNSPTILHDTSIHIAIDKASYDKSRSKRTIELLASNAL